MHLPHCISVPVKKIQRLLLVTYVVHLLYWNISGYIQRAVIYLSKGVFMLMTLKIALKYVQKILLQYYI